MQTTPRNARFRPFPGVFVIYRPCVRRCVFGLFWPLQGIRKGPCSKPMPSFSRLLIIAKPFPPEKWRFPVEIAGFLAVSHLIPPFPAFLKYVVSVQQHPSFPSAVVGGFSVFSIRAGAAFSRHLARKPGFRHEIPVSAATEPGNCAIIRMKDFIKEVGSCL